MKDEIQCKCAFSAEIGKNPDGWPEVEKVDRVCIWFGPIGFQALVELDGFRNECGHTIGQVIAEKYFQQVIAAAFEFKQ